MCLCICACMFPCVSGCIHSIVHTQRSEDNLRSQTSLSILFETVSLLGGHSVQASCLKSFLGFSYLSPFSLEEWWVSKSIMLQGQSLCELWGPNSVCYSCAASTTHWAISPALKGDLLRSMERLFSVSNIDTVLICANDNQFGYLIKGISIAWNNLEYM